MLPWVRKSAGWAGSQAPTFLTLAVLGGLGLWGAANDWKIPHSWGFADKEETKEAAEANVRAIPDSAPSHTGNAGTQPITSMRIEFPSADSVHKAGIQVVAVQVRSIAQYVTANGAADYEPSRYARLTARATGMIWRMEKEVGDRIRKGEILALVDAAEVGRAKADFLHSLTQVRLRTATLKQLQSLGDDGAISQRALRDADAALREARIRLFNDQQALLNLGLPFRLKDVENLAEDQLVRHMRLLGLSESLRKQLDPETLTANLLPVTAPFDGQVVQRNAALGEVMQLTQPKPMYIVADTSRLHIDLDVNPEDVADLRLGQTVVFRTEGARPETIASKLSHISPEVDEKTRRVRVHSEADNREGRLRPNAFGTARILIREHSDALVVPSEAVQSEGSIHLVFVRLSETSFHAREVRPGLREGDLLEVTGVRAGEEVVTTGSFMLKSELVKERIAGDEK